MRRHQPFDVESAMRARRACWCGARELVPFGPDYVRCRACETLISMGGLSDSELTVQDDEADFYGKRYWLEHVKTSFDQPDVLDRARLDLTERNPHWLSALLKYKLPPARVVELGCAHGSSVAMMRLAGYEASGTEMSPWVVSYAREKFGVPVEVATIETLQLEPASLDVIAMFDVLEHFSDPERSVRRCLELLKPDGLLLVQTPNFRPQTDYEDLVQCKDPFLDQLKPPEHLYLFSEASIREFLGRLSIRYFSPEPAIFAHYDMSFVASREPLIVHSRDQIDKKLLSSPGGRFVLALMDLRERELTLEAAWKNCEVDRAARLQVIQDQGAQLGRISTLEADVAYLKELLAATGKEWEGRLVETRSQLDELKASAWYRIGARLGLL
jgi:2-polyprenyl-3-methyl-5-hydroxy-6-metoxy-1,4-benzoquinol methylase